MQPTEYTGVDAGVIGERRHTEFGQSAFDERPMLRRDHRVEVDLAALGGDLGGHHHVDAERLAVGVLVHPFQDLVEFSGVVEPDAAEHTEPARPADRGRDLL